MRRCQNGFTLMELLIVLTLLGLLAVMAMPAMGQWLARQQLQGTAWELADTLRYARNSAITSQTPTRITFTAAADGGWRATVRKLDDDGAVTIKTLEPKEAGKIALATPGSAWPYSIEFSPLHGLPATLDGQAASGRFLLERNGCRPLSMELLITGAVDMEAAQCV